MQRAAPTAWSPASDRKIYVIWIGVVWAAILAGFGMDLARYLGETPSPPFILHVHAALFVLWLALVTLQILWIEIGNVRRHKQLGWLTVGVSALLVPLGIVAALVDQVRQIGHPDYAPQFLALEFEEMITFSVFVTAGVIFRRNPAAHKRLMILSAVAISDAGFGRIWTMGIKAEIPGLFGWWLQFFWGIFLILVAMGVWIYGTGAAFIQRCCSAQPSFGQARSSRPFSTSRRHGAMRWFGWSMPGAMQAKFDRYGRQFMFMVKHFVLTAAAALLYTACAGNARADAAFAVAKTASNGPATVALVTLEKSAYAAWESKDAKFWDTFLSDKFVGWGASGRLDKASAAREYTGADCAIRSYSLSDEKMRSLGKGAALLTYKIAVDGTCEGQAVPANSWAASVYVRDGGKWKGAFHAAAPVVNAKAAAENPADKKKSHQQQEGQPAAPASGTDPMVAVEKTVWEAWRTHDGKKMGELTTDDISFINIFGMYFPTKADALKDWTGTGCDVKRVSVTEAARTMLSPATGILTFKGTVDGVCYGQEVNAVIWGTSVYVKDGDRWKWTFGINVPSRGEGG